MVATFGWQSCYKLILDKIITICYTYVNGENQMTKEAVEQLVDNALATVFNGTEALSEDRCLSDMADQYRRIIENLTYPRRDFYAPKRRNFTSNVAYAIALDEFEAKQTLWNTKLRTYQLAEAEIVKMFKQEVFNFLEIANNPKREKLWKIAWEYGHANGFSQVAFYAEDLIELIR